MKNKLRRKRSASDGLSLIELLIALGMTGVILVPASSMMLQSYGNTVTYQQQNTTQQNARHAVDLIADDMRGALPVTTIVMVAGLQTTLPTLTVRGVSPSGTGANVTAAAPVYFNMSDDNGNPRRVRFWLQGTTLRREIVNYVDDTTTPGTPTSPTAGTVVAQNVQTFTAETQPLLQGLTLPNYNAVRLTVTTAQTSAGASTTETVTADATLRNTLGASS